MRHTRDKLACDGTLQSLESVGHTSRLQHAEHHSTTKTRVKTGRSRHGQPKPLLSKSRNSSTTNTISATPHTAHPTNASPRRPNPQMLPLSTPTSPRFEKSRSCTAPKQQNLAKEPSSGNPNDGTPGQTHSTTGETARNERRHPPQNRKIWRVKSRPNTKHITPSRRNKRQCMTGEQGPAHLNHTSPAKTECHIPSTRNLESNPRRLFKI